MNIWKLIVISGKVSGRDLTARQIIVISGLWGLVAKMSIFAEQSNESIYHAAIAQIITPAAASVTFWSRSLL